MEESNNLTQLLKPFYQRASEVEERLARLEAAAASNKKNSGNEDTSKIDREVQSKLEESKAEQAEELEKVLKEKEQLAAENAKLKYRITHLVRALKEN